MSSSDGEVGQFYRRYVTSQMATTNLTAYIATCEEKADLAKENLEGWGR